MGWPIAMANMRGRHVTHPHPESAGEPGDLNRILDSRIISRRLGDWRAYIRHAYVRVSAVRSGWEVRREPGGGEMMGMVKGYVYLSADYLA
ncbi:hypothetical protein [Burkholderia pseudomallei]|uniref:hypothetical protein n=1 Tax=Burkholderia pseudomallei TaxID=28450 RepID=UPI0004F5CB2B|nr:hypothetical protein [Burkholderia pseudomallei]AIP08864.1 hypothetical protein DP55_1775 [Burkholderia pseudomallei]KGC49545.1 hypothetical protein DO66_5372 [Burkholderia pseudomallei]